MVDQPNSIGAKASPQKRRGAPRGHTRFSAIPPIPVLPLPEWTVLEDYGGPLAFILWRVAADTVLWSDSDPEMRLALFHPRDETSVELLAFAAHSEPEIAEPLQTLWNLHSLPELADAATVAVACGALAGWAERRAMMRTAAGFAELAARVEPDSAARSYVAGRLCRRMAEYQRAEMWYRRSGRLGTRAGNLIDLANALLGLGNLESDLGHHKRAEKLFKRAAKAALRNGRKSLAAPAFHNLIGVTYDTGRKGEALEYLGRAADFYNYDHPRLPWLAYDAGFFLMREGYFSSALLIFSKVLPWVEGQRESILVCAAIARSAAAVRDNIRFQRTSAAVLAMVATNEEGAANALYQLAEGARSFIDWERARALAIRARDVAERRKEAVIAAHARRLLDGISSRLPGDVDRVPSEGDLVEVVTDAVIRKLAKLPAPATGTGAVPPEQYPTD